MIPEEIEALRELGVWNEDDDRGTGIAAEENFSDLEILLAG